MTNEMPKPLTVREKMVIALVLLLIKMLKPWEYDHMYTETFIDLKRIANGGDFAMPEKKS